jgi:hypothetical protein
VTARWLLRLTGIGIMILILARIDLPALGRVLERAALLPALAAAALTVPILLVKVARWRLLLGALGIACGFLRASVLFFAALALGVVTPGRLGEALRAFTLHWETGAPLARTFASVLADRLLDLAVLLGTGLVAGAFVLSAGQASRGSVAVIAATLAASLLMLWPRFWRLVAALALRIATRSGLQRDPAGGAPAVEAFGAAMRELFGPRLALGALATVAAYGLMFVQCWLIARSLGIPVGLGTVAGMMALANLAAFLPISILGVGTRDAVLVALFALVGLPAEQAVALSVGFLVLNNLVATAVGGIAWFGQPRPG